MRALKLFSKLENRSCTDSLAHSQRIAFQHRDGRQRFAVLHYRHGVAYQQPVRGTLLGRCQHLIRPNARVVRYMPYICRRIVLVIRSPSRHYGPDGFQSPLPVIRLAEYHKGSTPAPLHFFKLRSKAPAIYPRFCGYLMDYYF